MKETAQALDISHGSVSTFRYAQANSPLRPKSLSDEQMATRASVPSALLKRLGQTMIFFCVYRLGFIIMSQRIKLRVVSGLGDQGPTH